MFFKRKKIEKKSSALRAHKRKFKREFLRDFFISGALIKSGYVNLAFFKGENKMRKTKSKINLKAYFKLLNFLTKNKPEISACHVIESFDPEKKSFLADPVGHLPMVFPKELSYKIDAGRGLAEIVFTGKKVSGSYKVAEKVLGIPEDLLHLLFGYNTRKHIVRKAEFLLASGVLKEYQADFLKSDLLPVVGRKRQDLLSITIENMTRFIEIMEDSDIKTIKKSAK